MARMRSRQITTSVLPSTPVLDNNYRRQLSDDPTAPIVAQPGPTAKELRREFQLPGQEE
jgi:hypothetical protein